MNRNALLSSFSMQMFSLSLDYAAYKIWMFSWLHNQPERHVIIMQFDFTAKDHMGTLKVNRLVLAIYSNW